jgi:hypothetical protein
MSNVLHIAEHALHVSRKLKRFIEAASGERRSIVSSWEDVQSVHSLDVEEVAAHIECPLRKADLSRLLTNIKLSFRVVHLPEPRMVVESPLSRVRVTHKAVLASPSTRFGDAFTRQPRLDSERHFLL